MLVLQLLCCIMCVVIFVCLHMCSLPGKNGIADWLIKIKSNQIHSESPDSEDYLKGRKQATKNEINYVFLLLAPGSVFALSS